MNSHVTLPLPNGFSQDDGTELADHNRPGDLREVVAFRLACKYRR